MQPRGADGDSREGQVSDRLGRVLQSGHHLGVELGTTGEDEDGKVLTWFSRHWVQVFQVRAEARARKATTTKNHKIRSVKVSSLLTIYKQF